jgi:hypothetical protein
MSPSPEVSGGWPIRGSELRSDLETEFGDGITRITSAGIFLEPSAPPAEDLARWIGDYTVSQNLVEGQDLPDAWADRADEKLFHATMAGRKVIARNCADG